MSRRKIILDCDPGHDDAVAILLAGASEKIDLLGITTVAGNSYVHNTTRNALIISEMAGLDVGVYEGAAKPLIRNQIVAPDIHGESGLEGVTLPAPKKSKSEIGAVEFMADIVKKYPGEITLVPVGPLTNIALFILNHPELCMYVKEVVVMGGGIEFGNVTPTAEFNIFADPEAAQIVLQSGMPIVMVPLDVTHMAKINMEEIKELQKFDSEVVSKMGTLLEFFHQTYYDVFKIEGAPLHDPCTIAYLTDPDIFEYEEFYAEIELNGKLTYGQTVVDYWKNHGKKPNSKWLLKIDRKKYIDIIFEELKKYV